MRMASNPPAPRSSAARVAMTIIARMVIAPTDRSMPAVRMIRVCPMRQARDDGDLLEQEGLRVGLRRTAG